MAIQLISSDGSIITQQIGSCEWDLTIQVDTENNLVYGGVVTWLQDYDFYVSPAGYYLNNTFYESPEAFVTLAPADPVLDRFDVIYVDADQVVKVLQGTPSITASQPGLDLGTQLGLGVIFVQAASTQPGTANEECGYIDNAEWTASASDGSIDIASTNTPCSGTVSIEGTTVTDGDYFKLTRASAFALSPDFNNVHFVIRSKGAWGNRKLNIRWYNGGLPVGNTVAFGHGNTYNFASNNTVDCQLITLNASDFALPISQVVDEIRFTMSGNNNIGFFIDNICIQNNGSIVLPSDNDIHNQYFGPQTPGDWWIAGNNRTHGWITSPDILTGGDGSEKFGWGSRVVGSTGTAIGFLAQAIGQEGATAVGNQSVANQGVAIGFYAQSVRGVGIGGSQTGSGGVAVGWGSNSTGLSAIAIGGNAAASAISGVSLGYGAIAGGGYGAIAIGAGSNVSNSFSAGIGVFATTTADRQVVWGADHPIWGDFGYDSMYFGRGVTSYTRGDKFWTITGSQSTDVAGDKWIFGGAKGTGSANSGTIEWQTAIPTTSGTTLQSLIKRMALDSNTLGFYMSDTRFQMDEGADVAATGDLTLGEGNTFTITGSTTVNAITSTNWQDGAVIYLVFTSVPTLKHDTIGGAGTSRMRLAGAVDFTVTANTVLALVLKDGYWREIGRTQATVSPGGGLTADNGLTESTPDNVQLGGTLIHTTTVNTGGFQTNWTGSNSGLGILNLTNSGTGFGIASSTAGGGTAGYFTATGGTSVIGEQGLQGGIFSGSVIGVAAGGTTDTAIPLSVTNNPTTTNTSYRMISISRTTSGTASSGIGAHIQYDVESDGGTPHAGTLGFILTDVTNTTEDARFEMNSISGGVVARKMAIHDTGQMTLDKYGVGSFPDTPAYALGVDASGNVIEFTPGVGGGGFLTADNGLTASSATNVQLGGTLIQTTNIALSGYQFRLTGVGGNTINFDGNSGIDPFMAVHFENVGVTKTVDFQLYNDGLVFTENYNASTMDIWSNNGGTGMSATDGTDDTYVDSGANGYLLLRGSQAIQTDASSFQETLGTPAVAANDLNLLTDGNLFFVSGSTQINAIVSTNWQAGSKIQIEFIAGGTPTVKHNTTGGAGTAPIRLAGGEDYTAATEDILELVYDGGAWHEVNRKIAAATSGPTITLNNGLTKNTATNGQLGGTLIQTTTINSNSNPLIITGSVGSPSLDVTNTNNANVAAIQGTASGTVGTGVAGIGTNIGVQGNTTGGAGLYGIATAGIGVIGSATTGYGAQFSITPATTNTIADVMTVNRFTTGTAAVGIGAGILMSVQDAGGSAWPTNQLASKWTIATHASRTSQLDIVGIGDATTRTIGSFYGTGLLGLGISTGYASTRLQIVDDTLTVLPIQKITTVSTTLDNGATGIDVRMSGSVVNPCVVQAGYFKVDSSNASGNNVALTAVASGGANDTAVRADHTSASGYAVQANTGTGLAVLGNASSSGAGGSFSSISGQGLQASSVSGLPVGFINFNSGTTNAATTLKLSRFTSGTAAAGIGIATDYYIEGDSGSIERFAASQEVTWTDATVATRTSQIKLKAVLSAATVDVLTLRADGSMQLRPITATEASAITPVEGMIVIVNSTDGTFTSTGFWGYSGGAWGKF